jgi:opacity protein-like surface antigen
MSRGVGVAIVAVLCLLTSTVLAQSRSDLSINAFGSFVTQSSGQQVALAPTTSAGILATYRHALKQRHAVELNYAYTRNSQNYTLTDLSGTQTTSNIQSSVHEATADYVFTPRRSAKLSPFLLAGGGALVFAPTNNSNNTAVGAATEAKGVFVYGGGADYKLSGKIALRLEYRGLLYQAPDFNIFGYSTGAWQHTAEPSGGIVYRF